MRKVDVVGSISFRELMGRVREKALGGYSNHIGDKGRCSRE